MKDIICPKCKSLCFIDEWNGWVWTCIHCDNIIRSATDKEIQQLEKERQTNDSFSKKG